MGPTGFNSDEDCSKGVTALLNELDTRAALRKSPGAFEHLGCWRALWRMPKFKEAIEPGESRDNFRRENAADEGAIPLMQDAVEAQQGIFEKRASINASDGKSGL